MGGCVNADCWAGQARIRLIDSDWQKTKQTI